MKRWPILLIAVIFLLTRLGGLGTDILNSDAGRWYRRSENFLHALQVGDFASTYQNYQPGVTLMWINSATRKAVWEIQDNLRTRRWTLENADDFPKIQEVSKSVLVLVLFAIFVYQMFVISRIVDVRTAYIFGFFIATEPYLIGIDRWFHLTSLESYLAFSAFLTYLWALSKKSIRLYALSGVLLGLAVLSKLTAIVVLPLTLILIVLDPLPRVARSNTILRATILIIGPFFLTVFVLFPALWVNPVEVLQKLYVAASSAMGNDVRGQYFAPPFSYIYYAIIAVLKLSPITLLIFLISFTSKSKKAVLVYLLTYFLALTMAEKKIDRYLITLIPPMVFLVSSYLSRLKSRILSLAMVLQSTILIFALLINFPVFSGYYSPLFGGAKSALNLGVFENSGEYFAQAASYLNTKGRGDVYVPDNYEAFNYLYRGKTLRGLLSTASYLVTSVDFDRQVPRDIPSCSEIDRVFGPRYDISYVYVFHCDNVNHVE